MFSETNANINITNPLYNVTLKASDRFLKACPIKYDCRKLFVCLVELDFSKTTNDVEIILQYPEKLDQKQFNDKSEIDLMSNIKKFAFPFKSSLIQNNKNINPNYENKQSSALIKFYTFVFTDSNRIRLYGFCRSSQNGNRVLCLVSPLPWHNVYINLLNKLANVINEKATSVLYNLLEGLYEYDLPEPGETATVFSHDGQDQIQFVCPDRRNVPSINENRNLLKFFAFFDLNKLLKIFTALLLERRILIVSKDIENITSCALALEYLIYPLEWLHAFAPILPEHIDLFLFYQPFPYIYGIHTSIYEKLNESQLNESVILLVDDRLILNGDNDQLPKHVAHEIKKKLKFFQNPQASDVSRNTSKYDLLLKTGPIRAFQEAVLEIIGNYREYLYFDEKSQLFKVNDELFYQQHGVSNANKSDFYHEFRITQTFEEFIHDRADYFKEEKISKNPKYFAKDYIEYLFEQFHAENNTFQNILKSAGKKLEMFRKQAKEKQVVKKLFNGTLLTNQNSNGSSDSVANANDERVAPSNAVKTVSNSHQPSSNDSIYDELTQSSERTSNELKPSTLVFDNIDSKNLISLTYSSRSSSISSTNSSSNNNTIVDLNLAETIVKDPTVSKYLNKVDNSNHHDELVDLFNNATITETTTTTTTTTNNNNNESNSTSNDNPFVNDRFIDLFSIKKTFENIIKNDDDDDDDDEDEDEKILINLEKIKKATTLSKKIGIENGNVLIANKTSNSNSYQSIIDLFDPIKTNSDTQSQIITQQQQQQPIQSNLLPKQQLFRNQQQPQYSSILVNQPNKQYSYQNQQPQMSSSSSFPSYNQQQQQQNQAARQTFISSSPATNSYLSYAATPFYGFNQRPQFGYHSVPYPTTTTTTTATTARKQADKLPLTSNNATQQQQQQQQQQQTTNTQKSSLLFDNNNSLI